MMGDVNLIPAARLARKRLRGFAGGARSLPG